MRVLVTGGTGTLGRRLVPLLVEDGHQVVVLSRRQGTPGAVETIVGDLSSGVGLDSVTDGVDVIVHAATNPWRPKATDVRGTVRLVDAARSMRPHVVFVSVVGADRVPTSYYRAKRMAEETIERSGMPWTIVRATQFHNLVEQLLFPLPAIALTPRVQLQPVAPGDVARHIVELVAAGDAGRVASFGGPAINTAQELVAIRRRVTGKPTISVPAPAVGPFRGTTTGGHLAPEQCTGTVTWEAWLSGERP